MSQEKAYLGEQDKITRYVDKWINQFAMVLSAKARTKVTIKVTEIVFGGDYEIALAKCEFRAGNQRIAGFAVFSNIDNRWQFFGMIYTSKREIDDQEL